MVGIAQINLKDCVIVTQQEFDRLSQLKQIYLRVKMEIVRKERYLRDTLAWSEIT